MIVGDGIGLLHESLLLCNKGSRVFLLHGFDDRIICLGLGKMRTGYTH